MHYQMTIQHIELIIAQAGGEKIESRGAYLFSIILWKVEVIIIS